MEAVGVAYVEAYGAANDVAGGDIYVESDGVTNGAGDDAYVAEALRITCSVKLSDQFG